MRNRKIILMLLIVTSMVCIYVLVSSSYAHCDTMSGPVALAARESLRTGNFQSINIWVSKKQQQELRDIFEQCTAVRKLGAQARKLADRYFIETAVRLHREAEGMPYIGLKPAQPLPTDIAAAEKALEAGDIKIITDLLSKEIKAQTQKWFTKAMEAKKHKDKSVKAGREWVDSYVKYVVYVHGLYTKIQAGPRHGVED